MRRWVAALMLAAVCVVSAAGTVAAAEYRIEAMGGYNTSKFGYADDFKVRNKTFSIDISNEPLGDGPAWGAGVWIDNWIGRNWSLGFQYVGLKIEGSSGAVVGTIGNTPVGVGLGTDFIIHSFAANIAWRKNQGQWHPYIGAGLFFGFADGTLTGLAGVPGGTGSNSADFSVPLGGLQGFAGLDVDITKNIYVGLSGRAMYIDGRPIGIDLRLLDIVGLANIGFKF